MLHNRSSILGKLIGKLRKFNTRYRLVPWDQFENNLDFEMDTSIFLSHSIEEEIRNVLRLIRVTKVRRSLLVILNDVTEKDLLVFKSEIEQLKKNSMFFLVFKTKEGQIKWYQVITLNRRTKVIKIVLAQLYFDCFLENSIFHFYCKQVT